MNKPKISDTRREQIKKNFDLNKPPKREAELQYWNKVKAGKIRAQNAIKDPDTGKFVFLPKQFIERAVKPIAEANATTPEEYLKDKGNRADMKNLFSNSSVTWTYNPQTIEKGMKNLRSDKVTIDDGNGLRTMTKAQAKKYIQTQEKFIKSAGGYSLYFKTEFKNEFGQMIITLPDYASNYDADDPDALEMMQDQSEGVTIVESEKKKKK